MSTKATIEVDLSLFEQLKKYAKSKGRTITEVVEKQLKSLLGTEVKDKPVSSKLRGIVNLPENFDYKEELKNRSLENRGEFAEAASNLMDAAGRGEICVYISSLSYSNIYYIIRRYLGHERTIESLKELSKYVGILPVNGKIIRLSLDSEFGDFEDAIQYFSALQNRKIEAIVTRNVKDFKLSTLPVLQPSELLV